MATFNIYFHTNKTEAIKNINLKICTLVRVENVYLHDSIPSVFKTLTLNEGNFDK